MNVDYRSNRLLLEVCEKYSDDLDIAAEYFFHCRFSPEAMQAFADEQATSLIRTAIAALIEKTLRLGPAKVIQDLRDEGTAMVHEADALDGLHVTGAN